MRKILVIEDDPGVQDYLGHALRRQGWEVIQALTIEEARRFFADNPDLEVIALTPEVTGEGEREESTVALVQEFIAGGFRGHLIALISRHDDEGLGVMGCEGICRKHDLPSYLLRLPSFRQIEESAT